MMMDLAPLLLPQNRGLYPLVSVVSQGKVLLEPCSEWEALFKANGCMLLSVCENPGVGVKSTTAEAGTTGGDIATTVLCQSVRPSTYFSDVCNFQTASIRNSSRTKRHTGSEFLPPIKRQVRGHS